MEKNNGVKHSLYVCHNTHPFQLCGHTVLAYCPKGLCEGACALMEKEIFIYPMGSITCFSHVPIFIQVKFDLHIQNVYQDSKIEITLMHSFPRCGHLT